MASIKTAQFGSANCPQAQLDVVISSSTDTEATLKWTLKWVTHNGQVVQTSDNHKYSVTIDGATTNGSFAIGYKQSQDITSGTKTITKGTSAKSISFKLSFDMNITWSGTYGGTKTASGSISIPAKTSYKITYDANGGSNAPSSQTKWHGTSLTLSANKPTRTGYKFDGWATSETGTVEYKAGGTYTKNAKATLYAKWTINKYTVTYNANGGKDAPSSQTKTYGKDLTLSTTKPTRTGYKFDGWATSETGAVAYKAGGTYTANTSVTLYAKWTINKYTVTYNANGGKDAPSSQTKTYGKDLKLSSSKPTKTGNTFNGWAKSSSGSVEYSAGGTYKDNSSVTLYAKWTANEYTITYNANGGEGAPSKQTKEYGKDLKLSSSKPKKDGYKFDGWAKSASGAVVYKAGGTYTANASITLYAKWSLMAADPTISKVKISRCNENGVANDSGKYAKVEITWFCDQVAGKNTIKSLVVSWGDKSSNLTVNTSEGISGTTTSSALDGKLSVDKSYKFSVVLTDSKNRTASKVVTLPSNKYVLDFKSGGNGIAFGKTAEYNNLAEFGWKARFTGGVNSIELVANTDLNDILTSGWYYGTTTNIDTYKNVPKTFPGSFLLEVFEMGSTSKIQRISRNSKIDCYIYERVYYSSEWGEWYRIAGHNPNQLWSGSKYMTSDQAIELSEPISAQPSGIVLHFQYYSSGAQNSDHNYFYVPKSHIKSFNGKGIVFRMSTSSGSKYAIKYLYISDSTITGYSANNTGETEVGCGIKRTNNSYVLTEVLGV